MAPIDVDKSNSYKVFIENNGVAMTKDTKLAPINNLHILYLKKLTFLNGDFS